MNRRFLFLAIVLCAAITLFAQAKKDVLCVYNFTYSLIPQNFDLN